MPPDYELQSYWRKRFDDERHFEWLGDGKDTILPHVWAFLLNNQRSAFDPESATPARLLHIGAGTSTLSERLRELYVDVYGDGVNERRIVNADFVEELVTRQREAEAARAHDLGTGMQWVCADALHWSDLHRLVEADGGLFDLVVEKSTSDAISCGEDIAYDQASAAADLHPAFSEHLKTHPEQAITLSPVEVLAIHLASLVRPGGLWVALTFSSNRFPFLSSPENLAQGSLRAADYWSLENVVVADAPTGAQRDVHAPVVQHYVCLIRRKLPA